MQLAVFSDTHGQTARLLEVAKRHKNAGAFVFLGDGSQDADAVQRRFPKVPLYRVRGNCDFSSMDPAEGLVPFEGKLFLITHGHGYRVKQGLDELWQAARAAGADAALFGHTHTPFCQRREGIWLFNPGSLTMPRGCPPSYGLITVGEGRLDFELVEYRPQNR